MHRKIKTTGLTALALAAALAMAGCGSTASTETASETASEETNEASAESDTTEEAAEEAYTSGDDELDELIAELVTNAGADSGDAEADLEAAYRYLLQNSDYLGVGTPDFEDGWNVTYAKDMLDISMGNCFSYASVTREIAKTLGYDTVEIFRGSCVWEEEELSEHSWVLIDGEYVIDPLLEDRADNGEGDLQFFLKDYDTIEAENNCVYTSEGSCCG